TTRVVPWPGVVVDGSGVVDRPGWRPLSGADRGEAGAILHPETGAPMTVDELAALVQGERILDANEPDHPWRGVSQVRLSANPEAAFTVRYREQFVDAPIPPEEPVEPVEPIEPIGPIERVGPPDPVGPTPPTTPIGGEGPRTPVAPSDGPVAPVAPTGPLDAEVLGTVLEAPRRVQPPSTLTPVTLPVTGTDLRSWLLLVMLTWGLGVALIRRTRPSDPT
ncbi:MAG: hypothetical protein JJT89_17465, partial [Nitriliruptoraceae bacterium]|nr:hypothetical protein [Nitriliruptoraceae bacterium]